MSYFGRAFVFNDIPCEVYDLMMYDIESQDDDINIKGAMSIEDETVGDNWRPYFYGTRPGEKLEFDIVFGVNERRMDEGKFLDRWEIAEVTTWLTGHTGYKWLFIDQPDANQYGYRCMISDLQITRYGSVPWAMKAHVTCDSPYAYLETKNMTFAIDGERTIEIYNESSLNTPYYPIIHFTRASGTALSIKNEQDQNRGPEITNIPGAVSEITIDNERCVISNDQLLNLYSGFNFQFLRLMRGYNYITIKGTGTIVIQCEYPINVGG